MRPPTLALALALAASGACVPTSRAEPEPSSTPDPVAASVSAPATTKSEESPGSPAAVPAAPLEVDSKLVARTIIDSNAQPGLIELAGTLEAPGSLWIGKLEGNGGRDVLIHIPPGARDEAEFEFVYHFHGTYSEHVERKRDGLDKKKWVGWDRLDQTLAAAAELQTLADRRHNVVLIYPFSAGKRLEPTHKGWSNDMYDRMWMLPVQAPDYRDSFDRLHDEVVAILRDEFGAHPSKLQGPIIVEGHSAGGMALRNIAVAGSTKPIIEYLFLDAGFKSWADACWTALVAAGSKARLTMVITDAGIADPLAGRSPWCVELERDAALWPTHEQWCAGHDGDDEPRDSESDCETLELAAREWPDYEVWCRDMQTDMQAVEGVAVVRTKVVHGEQPRRFFGGMGLPNDRN